MILEWLQLQNVRNLEPARLEPGPHLNIFTGRNASGKTSVLEALYLLARARSFRTPRIQEVIRHGEETLRVTGKFQHEKNGVVQTGLERAHGQITIRRNGETVKTLSDQAQGLPLVLITQDSHTLLSGGPRVRRHWLDWAMFHVEPAYLDTWRAYYKALRQRNALLKQATQKRDLYRAWEEAMVESAYRLTGPRERFLQVLAAESSGDAGGLFPPDVQVKLYPGWNEARRLDEVLNDHREADRQGGYTRYGPHHADIRFTLGGKGLTSQFSRGQVKMYVTFLILAEARVLARQTAVTPLVLMDDFQAELDMEASTYLLTSLKQANLQAFLTTTALSPEDRAGGHTMFHVEQGRITG